MPGANVGSVSIEATKDSIKFACSGDIGSGSVILKTHSNTEKPDESIMVEMNEPVSLTFSLKYLTNFCKASGLAAQVKLCLSSEVPLLVEYGFEASYLRFYLAPKVCIHPTMHRIAANMDRLATRTKRIMIPFTHERHVSGYMWGICGAMALTCIERLLVHGSGVRHWRRRGAACGVFGALGTKGKLLPHQPVHVISRRNSDKEINTVNQQHTPPAPAWQYLTCLNQLLFSPLPTWLLTR